MLWLWTSLVLVGMPLCASLYYPVRGRRAGVRRAALGVLVPVILFLPVLLPPEWRPVRFLVAAMMGAYVCKLYDLHVAAQRGYPVAAISFAEFLWFVLHPLVLVHRRLVEQPPPPIRCNLRMIGRGLLVAVPTLALLLVIPRSELSTFPEQYVLLVIIGGFWAYGTATALVGLWRLAGGWGPPMMDNFLAAATPAEFWRRWNVPVHEFFRDDVFRIWGGPRHPVRVTLGTFILSGLFHEYVFGVATGCVQGWQLAFFLTQGIAVAATARLEPRRGRLLAIAATWLFLIASSLLFLTSWVQLGLGFPDLRLPWMNE